MKKITGKCKNNLLKNFSDILRIRVSGILDEPVNHNEFAVSIFDHWLTEEEADLMISKVLWKGDESSSCREYKIAEQKYLSFLKQLSKFNNIYIIEENEKNDQLSEFEYTFWEIENYEELEEVFLSSIREEKLSNICLPELGLIIFGGYDMTQIVYIKKEFKSTIFHKIVEESQLYILK